METNGSNGHCGNGSHSSNGNGHGNLDQNGKLFLTLERHGYKMTPQQHLLSIMQMRQLPQCLYIAAERRIANYVSSEKPINIRELAKQLCFDETNLHRFMSYLASHGIFHELENGNFVGNELSDAMRDDYPANCRAGLCWAGGQPLTSAMLNMEHSLKTGGSSFEHANGSSMYQFLAENPESQLKFDSAMPSYHSAIIGKVVAGYDFSRYRTIVELGGGRGNFVKEILTRYPTVEKATLVELESSAKNVLPELTCDPKLRGRFSLVAGDFLLGNIGVDKIDDVPDLFVIMNTLQTFNDADAVKILTNVAKIMKNSSRFLIIDYDTFNYGPNEPANLARCVDLLMMYLFGGKQRNAEMWRQLFSKANLKLTSNDSEFTGLKSQVNGIIRFPPMFTAYECELAVKD